MESDVLADGGLQFFEATENASANAFVGDLGEPALDQVDPGAISGREVDMEARPFGNPVTNGGCLMRAVIIHDDMNLQFGGHMGFDGVEKLAKFLRTMTAMQLSDHAVGL